MKILIFLILILLLFVINPIYLLLTWVATSPFISNFIARPWIQPFLGGYHVVDYRTAYVEGFAFRELFTFDRIVLILIFLFVLLNGNIKKSRINKFDILFFIFIAALTLSAVNSENPLLAFRYVFDSFGLCYLAFFIGKHYLYFKSNFNKFLMAFTALGAFIIPLSILEKIYFISWSGYRVCGPFRYWEDLGVTVSLIFFILWYQLKEDQISKYYLRIAIKWLSIMAIIVLFLTETRTIIISIIIANIFVYYKGSHILGRNIKLKQLLIIFASTIAIFLSLELIKETEYYERRIANEATVESRTETYIAAYKMFINNPLFGIGLKNFEPHMQYYINWDEINLSIPGRSSLHNSYLVILAEAGLIGLIPFILLIMFIFISLFKFYNQLIFRADKLWILAVLGMSIVFFLSPMTFDPFFQLQIENPLYYMILGLTVGLVEQRGRTYQLLAS